MEFQIRNTYNRREPADRADSRPVNSEVRQREQRQRVAGDERGGEQPARSSS